MPGGADYGLLYFGSADGGSGGDPFNAAQNLGTPFGKMLRIDPLGNNSANGKYGIPPQSVRRKSGALGEITRTASATRSALAGIRRTAISSSPKSARTSSRRSTS